MKYFAGLHIKIRHAFALTNPQPEACSLIFDYLARNQLHIAQKHRIRYRFGLPGNPVKAGGKGALQQQQSGCCKGWKGLA